MPKQDVAVGRGAVNIGEGRGVVPPSELLSPAAGVAAREKRSRVRERDPCPGEGRGVSVGEEEVVGAGVAVSVPSRAPDAGAVEDVVTTGGRVDGSSGEPKRCSGEP